MNILLTTIPVAELRVWVFSSKFRSQCSEQPMYLLSNKNT